MTERQRPLSRPGGEQPSGAPDEGPPRASPPQTAGRQAGEGGRRRFIAESEERPGDPVCLLRRVCPACGAVADTDPPTVCPACGTGMPAA
jgi:hypothetical protein